MKEYKIIEVDYDKISTKIQHLCEQKGLSLRTVEGTLNIGYGSIRRWKIHKPTFDKVFKVAMYLGIPCESLVLD